MSSMSGLQPRSIAKSPAPPPPPPKPQRPDQNHFHLGPANLRPALAAAAWEKYVWSILAWFLKMHHSNPAALTTEDYNHVKEAILMFAKYVNVSMFFSGNLMFHSMLVSSSAPTRLS